MWKSTTHIEYIIVLFLDLKYMYEIDLTATYTSMCEGSSLCIRKVPKLTVPKCKQYRNKKGDFWRFLVFKWCPNVSHFYL